MGWRRPLSHLGCQSFPEVGGGKPARGGGGGWGGEDGGGGGRGVGATPWAGGFRWSFDGKPLRTKAGPQGLRWAAVGQGWDVQA